MARFPRRLTPVRRPHLLVDPGRHAGEHGPLAPCRRVDVADRPGLHPHHAPRPGIRFRRHRSRCTPCALARGADPARCTFRRPCQPGLEHHLSATRIRTRNLRRPDRCPPELTLTPPSECLLAAPLRQNPTSLV